MKAFCVEKVKEFMGGLLTGSLFNDWEFRGAELGLDVEISFGTLANHSYLSDYEAPYLPWPMLQEKICGLIKGKKQPSKIHMSLALAPEKVPGGNFSSVEAYVMNIQYENGVLLLITAISEKSFSLDKEPSRLWDEYLPTLLSASDIDITEA